jgi:hypothetical protein
MTIQLIKAGFTIRLAIKFSIARPPPEFFYLVHRDRLCTEIMCCVDYVYTCEDMQEIAADSGVSQPSVA